MRRLPIAVAVAVTSVLAAHASGATEPPPTLRVVDRSPLVIEGQGFAPREVVTLIARIPGVVERKTLRANDLGRFRVTITRIALTEVRRCAARVVIAAQTSGGGLVLWHPRGLPNCPSPLHPPSGPTVPSV
jgi:hypothetical protein